MVDHVEEGSAIGKGGGKVTHVHSVDATNLLRPLEQQAETLRVAVYLLARFSPKLGIIRATLGLECLDLGAHLLDVEECVDLKVHDHLPQQCEGDLTVAHSDGLGASLVVASNIGEGGQRHPNVVDLSGARHGGELELGSEVITGEQLEDLAQNHTVAEVLGEVRDTELVLIERGLYMSHREAVVPELLYDVTRALERLTCQDAEQEVARLDGCILAKEARVRPQRAASFGLVEKIDEPDVHLERELSELLLKALAVHPGDGWVGKLGRDGRAEEQPSLHELAELGRGGPDGARGLVEKDLQSKLQPRSRVR